jgi:hypothetical protein
MERGGVVMIQTLFVGEHTLLLEDPGDLFHRTRPS